jgi:hypothetical protein
MNEAKTFIDCFNPYRQKYAEKCYSSLFNDFCWLYYENHLSIEAIQKALNECLTIGYFITNSTTVIGIDIDDHKNNGEAYLLNLYNQVKNKIGALPSLLFKSPRGLYCYYFFNQRIPTDIAIKSLKNQLVGIPVELKPTTSTSLRIPSIKKQLDPETLQLQNISFDEYVIRANKYHPVEILSFNALPDNVKQSLKSKKTSLRKFKNLNKIDDMENELLPFENGNTNETFLKLCNVYRCAGLDIDDTLYRFNLCLEKSPLYFGDLRNYKKTAARVKAEYKKNSGYIPVLKHDQPPSLFTSLLINNIIIQYREYFVNICGSEHQLNRAQKISISKKIKSIEKFLLKLIAWVEYQDDIYANKKNLAVWDFMYTYYRKNRKEGFYPLPNTLLNKWNTRYYTIIDFLKAIDFIVESGYQYSKQLNICKYYTVNINKFLK